jgi:hypothetical protein
LFTTLLYSRNDKLVVVTEKANIYAEPFDSCFQIETIYKGTILEIFQTEYIGESWYYVTFDSKKWLGRVAGFIHKSDVRQFSGKQPLPTKLELMIEKAEGSDRKQQIGIGERQPLTPILPNIVFFLSEPEEFRTEVVWEMQRYERSEEKSEKNEAPKSIISMNTETWILLATLAAIIFSIWLTYEIKKTTIRQAEREVTPKIVLLNHRDFTYKNLGKGDAINIQVDELTIDLVSVSFKPLGLLESHSSAKVNFNIVSRNSEVEAIREGFGEVAEEILRPPFFEGLKVPKYELTIHYQNVEKRRFMSEVLVDCDKRRIELLKSGKA